MPKPLNDDPFRVWNSPEFIDDPLAPHNDSDGDDPLKPWNDPSGDEDDLESADREYYCGTK